MAGRLCGAAFEVVPGCRASEAAGGVADRLARGEIATHVPPTFPNPMHAAQVAGTAGSGRVDDVLGLPGVVAPQRLGVVAALGLVLKGCDRALVASKYLIGHELAIEHGDDARV